MSAKLKAGSKPLRQKNGPIHPTARPMTQWGKDGKMKSRLYNTWPSIVALFNQRQRDMIDIFHMVNAAQDVRALVLVFSSITTLVSFLFSLFKLSLPLLSLLFIFLLLSLLYAHLSLRIAFVFFPLFPSCLHTYTYVRQQPPIDPNFTALTWDISQNADMASPIPANPGVVGCITPGGWTLTSSRPRTMVGNSKLLFNGIPTDRLKLGPETEVQLSDLAGTRILLYLDFL